MNHAHPESALRPELNAMTITRGEEQQQFAESLRRFLQTENNFETRRQRLNAVQPRRIALWPGLADLGVLGAAFDEAAGGFAGDNRTLSVIMVELGGSLAVEPFLACAWVCGRILAAQADHQLRERTVAGLISGDCVTTLAHDSGPNPFGLPRTVARKRAGTYVIDGMVPCTRHADVADEFLVTATLDTEIAVFRVPRSGLRLESYRLMDGSGAADIHMNQVRLPPQNRLAFTAPVRKVLASAWDRALLAISAETAGIVEAANAITFRYLTERKQFGAPLASFQALQHRAADMEIAALELRAMLALADESTGAAPASLRLALLAALKSGADRCGRLVGHEAIQLHGAWV